MWDLLNKLNVDIAWKNWRLATRFDTGVFFDTLPGSCGPEKTTPASILSRLPAQEYIYLEKIPPEYPVAYCRRPRWATPAVSFGRGLRVARQQAPIELGIDTTLAVGGKFTYHEGNLSPFGGASALVDIQNIDEATPGGSRPIRTT